MSGRYRRHAEGDDDVAREGDAIFVGMMSKLSPDKIPQNYCRELVNKSCRTGRAATRGGMLTLLQLNPRRQPGATDTAIHAAAPYTDAAGAEWLLVATERGVWQMKADTAPTLLTTPEALSARCELVQFNTVVLLFRGEEATPWVWDGTAAGFEEAEQLPTDDATLRLPGADYAETIDNRLVVTQGADRVLFTDILDWNSYDLLNVFRAQQGEDALVRVFPFTGNSMLLFKSRSIYLLDGITGDLTGAALEEVNRSLGLAARRAVAAVGADVFFLSRTGVFRISQVVESRIATQPVPVSDAIEPFFRTRVNWNAIAGAVAVTHDEYFSLALPIDGSTGNNALLRYNTSTGAWEGHWTFPAGASVIDLVKLDVRGQERLVAIDGANAWTYLLEEGHVDRVNDTDADIADAMESRGYLLGDPGHKQVPRCEATLATWHPHYSVTAKFDGANTSQVLVSARTKSRTRYTVHARAAYDASNVNDDHATPRREDYSMNLAVPFRLGTGVVLDRQQSTSEQWPIRARARWVTLRIESTQGVCEVETCGVQGLVQDRDLKPKQ